MFAPPDELHCVCAIVVYVLCGMCLLIEGLNLDNYILIQDKKMLSMKYHLSFLIDIKSNLIIFFFTD